jgi:hypothetical protein
MVIHRGRTSVIFVVIRLKSCRPQFLRHAANGCPKFEPIHFSKRILMKRHGGFNNPEPLILIAIAGVLLGILAPIAKRDGTIGWTAFAAALIILVPMALIVVTWAGASIWSMILRFRRGSSGTKTPKTPTDETKIG